MEPIYFHSVVLKPERCIGCTYCLKVCPTEAIRLRNGKARIIAERCIDCGECIRVCPNHAKSAITDDLKIIKRFKYSIALTLPVLYGQFSYENTPYKILAALKSLGFDDVYDTSFGFKVKSSITPYITKDYKVKPVISSSCPAILRLMQVRFPDLLNNVLDIDTTVEITAKFVKEKISRETGLKMSDIGIILITPCTARVTSIKNPLGIDFSYIDGTISIKDIYGPMLKALSSNDLPPVNCDSMSSSSVLCNNAGGQLFPFKCENILAVDGIHNAISILEEIEMNKLDKLAFIEITACPGGCIGGPLVVENRYIALNNIKNTSLTLENCTPSNEEIDEYMNMYKTGSIRYTRKIDPKAVIRLDPDIKKSIVKMEAIREIATKLPGIDCGICGAPTCQAFAEDIVTGSRNGSVCPISNIVEKTATENK